MYDVTTDRVSLISIHSSKAWTLTWSTSWVSITSVDRGNEAKPYVLVYVAMTRAKYRLVIPYVEETDLISRIKDCRLKPTA